MGDERRRDKRHTVTELRTNISDGSASVVVLVDDVSTSGICVSQIPDDFDASVGKCLAVVNAPHLDITLELQPRWVQNSEQIPQQRIGFQIENPPAEWLDFVNSLKEEPVKKKREATRYKLFGMIAVISDGKTKCIGVVEDVSKNGLRLTQVGADFDETAVSCTALVQSPEADVHVSLHPCWISPTNRGMYKTIGFAIQNPPAAWREMIEALAEGKDGKFEFLIAGSDGEPDSDLS